MSVQQSRVETVEQYEARQICVFLRVDFGGSEEVRRSVHQRAETMAELLRVYAERERLRMTRC